MEGNSAVTVRRNAAYALLVRMLRYTGQVKFSFDGLVRRHIEANVILMDEGEPIPETKKVTSLLAGVQVINYSHAVMILSYGIECVAI